MEWNMLEGSQSTKRAPQGPAIIAAVPLAVPTFTDCPAPNSPAFALYALEIIEQYQHIERAATKKQMITPRGLRIAVHLLARPLAPNELAEIFQCGRSLISRDLKLLMAAAMVSCRSSHFDRRRQILTLTPYGEQIASSAAADLSALLDLLSFPVSA